MPHSIRLLGQCRNIRVRVKIGTRGRAGARPVERLKRRVVKVAQRRRVDSNLRRSCGLSWNFEAIGSKVGDNSV